MKGWQDKVIAAVTALFALFLLPQLYDVVCHQSSMNPITAFCTAGGMILLTVAYASEGKKLSTVTTAAEAVLWFMLGVIGR